MFPECTKRTPDGICLVATELAMLHCTPTEQQCEVCTNHPTLPQRRNGVTCAVAYETQKQQGLEPNPNLLNCIHTEQVLPEETLQYLRAKWIRLHTMTTRPWNPEKMQNKYAFWVSSLPTFGCDCSQHWDVITEQRPIRFSNHLAFFESTWFAHNKVNEKLHKDPVEFLDAILFWDQYVRDNSNKSLFL